MHYFPLSRSVGSTLTTTNWECIIVCAVMFPFSGVFKCFFNHNYYYYYYKYLKR